MPVSDAELLDTVRRLRTYMTTIDSCHMVFSKGSEIGDSVIESSITTLLPELFKTGQKISQTLKLIENSKSYRDMLRKFNMKEDEGEEDGDD
jgi:hypothetical protein